MPGGAPKGNQNAKNAKEWQQAIKRALSRYSKENWRAGLDKCADQFVQAAASGDAWALKEIGDRIEGKPRQQMELSGPDGGEIPMSGTVRFVDSETEDG